MPEGGMAALTWMIRERAEQLGFSIPKRAARDAARDLVLSGAADPSNLNYADTTGEAAVDNVLAYYMARYGSLAGAR